MGNDYLIEPAISAAKFERELVDYRQLQDTYIARGWYLVKAVFPQIFVVFGTPNLKPPAIAFGALIDFTNYDFWPLSVRLADPFTQVPYKAKDLPALLVRAVVPPTVDGKSPQSPIAIQPQPLMQYYGDDEVPFLCLPGVREYHENPAHTGDSWLIHRAQGEGSLHFILEQLYHYGSQCAKAYGIECQVQVKITGLGYEVSP